MRHNVTLTYVMRWAFGKQQTPIDTSITSLLTWVLEQHDIDVLFVRQNQKWQCCINGSAINNYVITITGLENQSTLSNNNLDNFTLTYSMILPVSVLHAFWYISDHILLSLRYDRSTLDAEGHFSDRHSHIRHHHIHFMNRPIACLKVTMNMIWMRTAIVRYNLESVFYFKRFLYISRIILDNVRYYRMSWRF